MQTRRFASLSMVAAIVAAMGMTSCVDNEEGDGLQALREGIGNYYNGKAEVEKANAATINAKINAEVAYRTAEAKALEIKNAFDEANNAITLLLNQSNAELKIAQNDRTNVKESAQLKVDTAGTFYKILAALQKEQAAQLTQEEALAKVQELYDYEIASYKEDARQKMQTLLLSGLKADQDSVETSNTLALRIIQAEIDYAYNLASKEITRSTTEIKLAKEVAADSVAKLKLEADLDKIYQQGVNDVLVTNTAVQKLIKEYNDAKAAYEKQVAEVNASANYSEEVKEYEAAKAAAEYATKVSTLEKEAAKALLDLAATVAANEKEVANYAKEKEAAVVADSIEMEASSATDEAVKKLIGKLDTYINAVKLAQDTVNIESKALAAQQQTIVAKQLEIIKKQLDLNSAIFGDSATLAASISAKEVALNVKTDSVAAKEKALKEAEAALKVKEAEYNETVAPWNEAIAQHNDLKAAVEAAQKAYDTANDNKTAASSNLTIATKALTTAQNDYKTFYTDSISAYQKKTAAKTALDNANSTLKDAKTNYNSDKSDANATALAQASEAQLLAAATYNQATNNAAYYTSALSIKYLTEIKTQKANVEKYTQQVTEYTAKMSEATTKKTSAEDKLKAYEGAQYKTAKANYEKAAAALAAQQTKVTAAEKALATAEKEEAEAKAALAKAQEELKSFLANKSGQTSTDAAQTALVEAQDNLNKELLNLDAQTKKYNNALAALEEAEANYQAVKDIIDAATGADKE